MREETEADWPQNDRMKIVLMRHGKPLLPSDTRLSASEFGNWIAAYNAAGLDPSLPPPALAISQAQGCRYTVCSQLRRSTASAGALGVSRIDLQSADFREMELPHARGSWPRLPAHLWIVLFRMCWLAGYAAHSESFLSARQRARAAAVRLIERAQQHETVLFVGHGLLNGFIARHLKQAGWQSRDKTPRRYWESCVFTLPHQATGKGTGADAETSAAR